MKRITRPAILLLACALFGLAPATPPAAAPQYPFATNAAMYRDGWVDFNKNSRKDVYEDPAAPLDARIDDLLGQMTLDEKSCQLATLYGYRKYTKDILPTEQWKNEIWKDGIANIDQHADAELIAETRTPELHAKLLNTTQRFFVEQTRLGIPVDFTLEGIRGLSARHATGFPSTNAIGSTWDTDLVYRMAAAMADEARAIGYTNVYSPILDVARDQRWGRWEGALGEDPYLVARLGVAWARGFRDHHLASTAKHFVAYGECRAARQWDTRTDPAITLQTLEMIHLYPFRKAIQEGGLLGVMCAYNDYDGVPMAASFDLLTRKLRNEYGFRGYIVSDSGAIERLQRRHFVAADLTDATRLTIEAGVNVRTDFDSPAPHITAIRQLVRDGRLAERRVDDLVRDVLRVKFLVGLFDRPYVPDPAAANRVVGSQLHRELALQMSREAMVLLKNDGNLLPLDPAKVRRLALIGPNADNPATVSSHYGPSDIRDQIVTVREGFQKLLAGKGVAAGYAKGCEIRDPNWPDSEILPEPLSREEQQQIDEAVKTARQADVAVVVLGDQPGVTSGESRSRFSLELPGRQLDLLKAVHATGKPVILVLMHGRPTAINWAQKYVPAILSVSLPGAPGGTAIAETLFGVNNPGGKLNGSWPKHVGQIPLNFPAKPGANVEPEVKLGSRAHLIGQLYYFGHGLSYTTFGYSDLRITPDRSAVAATIQVAARVKNTGAVAGDEVVQLYVRDDVSTDVTYEQVLRGFRRIHLGPGEEQDVRFTLTADDLAYAMHDGTWVVEPGLFKVMVGSSSRDIRLNGTFTLLPKDAVLRGIVR